MSDRTEHDDRHRTAETGRRTGRQGRLRLQWPTFRGAPFLWGVLAVPLLLDLVTTGVALGHGDELTPFRIVFVIVVALAFVVCLVGVVQTFRHPRPSPPSWLDQGDPRA